MNHEFVGQVLGFIVANSAAIGDALEADELMVPYVISIKDGKREITDFESDTQELSVKLAESELAKLSESVDAWSYSRDGLITLDNGEKQDVFLFKIWAKGMSQPLEAYQMYEKSTFKLIGNVKILNYVETGLSAEHQDDFVDGLDEGIAAHPIGNQQWESWLMQAN